MTRHIKSFHPKDPLTPIPMNWVEEVEREEMTATPDLVVPPPPPMPVPSMAVPPPPPIPVPPAPVQEKSAFNKRLVQKKWFIRGEKDILKVFTNYKERVRNAVILRKHELKIDLVIKVRMSRQDQEGEQQEVSQFFCGEQD